MVERAPNELADPRFGRNWPDEGPLVPEKMAKEANVRKQKQMAAELTYEFRFQPRWAQVQPEEGEREWNVRLRRDWVGRVGWPIDRL